MRPPLRMGLPPRTGLPPLRLRAPAEGRGSGAYDLGSGAIAVVMLAFLFLSMAALVVDGGMTLNRRERAADLAEQAARYAAQDIDVDALRGGTVGDTAPINYAHCDANVRDYLTKVGLDVEDRSHSGCTSKSAEQVTVVVQLTWKPLISGIVMRGAQHAKGTATAESVTG